MWGSDDAVETYTQLVAKSRVVVDIRRSVLKGRKTSSFIYSLNLTGSPAKIPRNHDKMSVTTTDNPVTTTLQHDYLQDYNIRLTGGDQVHATEQHSAPPNTDNRPPEIVENPPGWDDQHRDVPPYRPVNTNLDREQRPWGSNPIESAFVFHMLHGVWLNSVSLCWQTNINPTSS